MEETLDHYVTPSFPLTDALAVVCDAESDDAISEYFVSFFGANPDLREPFAKAFRDMILDRKYTATEKCALFFDRDQLSDAEASRQLCKIYHLATGMPMNGG